MTFQTGQGDKLRILDIAEMPEDSEFNGMFVVSPVTLAEPD